MFLPWIVVLLAVWWSNQGEKYECCVCGGDEKEKEEDDADILGSVLAVLVVVLALAFLISLCGDLLGVWRY